MDPQYGDRSMPITVVLIGSYQNNAAILGKNGRRARNRKTQKTGVGSAFACALTWTRINRPIPRRTICRRDPPNSIRGTGKIRTPAGAVARRTRNRRRKSVRTISKGSFDEAVSTTRQYGQAALSPLGAALPQPRAAACLALAASGADGRAFRGAAGFALDGAQATLGAALVAARGGNGNLFAHSAISAASGVPAA